MKHNPLVAARLLEEDLPVADLLAVLLWVTVTVNGTLSRAICPSNRKREYVKAIPLR